MARVLLVEDDVVVCDFVRRALEMDDHDVTPVCNRGEALERLLSPVEQSDPLPRDILMPVMDGVALALQAARDLPDLPILLMTGYAEHRERAYGLEALIKGIVQKPFTLAHTREQVNKALEPKASAACVRLPPWTRPFRPVTSAEANKLQLHRGQGAHGHRRLSYP
jgi:two-component system cell cycle response regulator CpdR